MIPGELQRGSVIMDSKKKCANCGIIIHWQPTLLDGKIYCCPGCAGGGPCICDYDNLPAEGEMQAMILKRSEILYIVEGPNTST
jgi:hypothetical protein